MLHTNSWELAPKIHPFGDQIELGTTDALGPTNAEVQIAQEIAWNELRPLSARGGEQS